MKLLVAVYVVLVISLTHASPTIDDNQADIIFSEENKAEDVEEALFVYAELLKGINQKFGVENEVANDQTTAYCTDPDCNCDLKYEDVNADTKDFGKCTVRNVPYCKGVCLATYKYVAVQ